MVLRFFWLGVIEATRPELCPSFFQVDSAPTILGFLGRDDIPSPLDPATVGSRRRGVTSSPLVPEILGVLSDDTSPPLIPEIPGVLGRNDTSPPLAPEILGALRRGDTHPAFSSIYLPSSNNFSGPMSPTVQLAGIAPDHQNIAPAMPGLNYCPQDSQTFPRPFTRNWSHRAYTRVLYNIRVNNA
jgi:hypothetical protein